MASKSSSFLSDYLSPWQFDKKINFNPKASFSSSQFEDILKTYPFAGTDESTIQNQQTQSIGSPQEAIDVNTQWIEKNWPLLQKMQSSSLQSQLEYNQAAMQQAYPYLSQAASEATARNLAASKAYASFKESLPSNLQNIMASRQSQMASAAGAEATREQAMASLVQAVAAARPRYAGQTFTTA